jgi:hypothetical protein
MSMPRDACHNQGTLRPRAHHPRDALSMGRYIRDFLIRDTLVRDTLSCHRPGSIVEKSAGQKFVVINLCVSNHLFDVKVKTSKDAANNNNIL